MPKRTDPNWKPKYRPHKNSGQAVVTLSGKDVYLGPFDTEESRRRYDQVVGEWLAAGRRTPKIAVDERVSVAELVADYRAYAEGYYATGERKISAEYASLESATQLLERYFRIAADDFGPLALREVRELMVSKGWSRQYTNRQVKRIRRMFSWGVSEQKVRPETLVALKAVDPLRRGKTPAPETTPVTPVAEAWVEAVKPHCTRPVRAMVELMWLTGMRPGEVIQMTTGAIDRRGEVWVYSPERHKLEHRGIARAIPLGPKAQEVVTPFLRMNAEEHLFRPADALADMFEERAAARAAPTGTPAGRGNMAGTNRKKKPAKRAGSAYDVGSFRQSLWRACDRAFPLPPELCARTVPVTRRRKGKDVVVKRLESAKAWRERLTPAEVLEVKRWRVEHRFHPYQLRHAAATNMRRMHGREVAQVLLGHKHAATTEIYAKPDYAEGKRIAKLHG